MPPVHETVSKILEHINCAQKLGASIGIPNIVQPGIVRELLLSQILMHDVIPDKADADARDSEGRLYEYLSSLQASNNFQIDRVTNDNLDRITRNECVYCAFFSDTLTVAEIYRLETNTVLAEVKRQLKSSKNEISHLNLPGGWVRKNGARVYPKAAV